jgi:hypothetical protein
MPDDLISLHDFVLPLPSDKKKYCTIYCYKIFKTIEPTLEPVLCELRTVRTPYHSILLQASPILLATVLAVLLLPSILLLLAFLLLWAALLLLSFLLLLVAGVTAVACISAAADIPDVAGVPLFPDVLTAAGLPDYCGVPGVLAVVPAAAGLLSIAGGLASITCDPGVPILAGVFTYCPVECTLYNKTY